MRLIKVSHASSSNNFQAGSQQIVYQDRCDHQQFKPYFTMISNHGRPLDLIVVHTTVLSDLPLSIHSAERDSPQLGVNARQLRDVGCILNK